MFAAMGSCTSTTQEHLLPISMFEGSGYLILRLSTLNLCRLGGPIHRRRLIKRRRDALQFACGRSP